MVTTYLITGGAGNLARQMVPHLLAGDSRIVLADIAQLPPEIDLEGCSFVQADLTQPGMVEKVFSESEPDIVLHLASLLSGKCEEDREAGWSTNVTAGFALYEAALRHEVKTFFFASTIASFGGALPDPVPEDQPQWPQGLYGVSKMVCERLGMYYHVRHGLDFRCIRIPLVVSRLAHLGAASAYASLAFIQSVRAKRFVFKVHPTTRVESIYAPDVSRAIIALVSAPVEKLSRRVYSLHALSPTAQELADAIVARVPDAKIAFDPDPLIASLAESWPEVVVDKSARADWGWSPKFDLDAMADHFVQELRGEFDGSSQLPTAGR